MPHRIMLLIAAGVVLLALPGMARSAPPRAGPDNDPFSYAWLLTGDSGTQYASNVGATKESWETYNHAGNAGGASVWFRWVAASNALVQFSTLGSKFDTLLAVYTWPGSGPLIPTASNDNNWDKTSFVSFDAVAGTTYYVAVDGYDGSSGDIVLNWGLVSSAPPARPVNDDFAYGWVVEGSKGYVTGTSVGATRESFETGHAGNMGGASIWYRWTAPTNDTMVFDCTGSTFNSLLAVYIWPDHNASLIQVGRETAAAYAYPRVVTFSAIAGTLYYIAVDGYNAGTGSVLLAWHAAQEPTATATVTLTPIPIPSRTPTRTPMPASNLAPAFEPTPASPVGRQGSVGDHVAGGISPLLRCDNPTKPGHVDQLLQDVEAPAELLDCFDGFGEGPLTIEIKRPDGKVRYVQHGSPGRDTNGWWHYIIPPEDGYGVFAITVTHGSLKASRQIRVIAPTRPHMLIAPYPVSHYWWTEHPEIAQGGRMVVYVTGFPASRRISLHLMRVKACPGGTRIIGICFGYQESFVVTTNAQGQGSFLVTLAAAYSPDRYLLVADHPSYSANRDPSVMFVVILGTR